MKFLILIFLGLPVFAFEQYELPAPHNLMELSEKIAISQKGIIESKNNSGEVEKYLNSVGLNSGQPYCAAAQYWCIKAAADSLKIDKFHFPKTGLARNIFNYFKKNGNKCRINPQRHSFIIWQKGKSKFGHIERIIASGKAGNVRTIAFNVTVKNNGKKYEGVAIKKRNIYHILNRMHVLGIASFKGVSDDL